ncbi:hypothetical protein BS47DRAFT_1402727 [Hydnum rufescens UP504]|uniref:Uncharacterized protein n=1 Tax=Hydnum rufescens UP504 TaxID=1448309 RepID=A0A9P6ABR8_9AGAM|nr:hypothetical protein BS47DRAFT_1402727 [Hydnum rufescens UP504]
MKYYDIRRTIAESNDEFNHKSDAHYTTPQYSGVLLVMKDCRPRVLPTSNDDDVGCIVARRAISNVPRPVKFYTNPRGRGCDETQQGVFVPLLPMCQLPPNEPNPSAPDLNAWQDRACRRMVAAECSWWVIEYRTKRNGLETLGIEQVHDSLPYFFWKNPIKVALGLYRLAVEPVFYPIWVLDIRRVFLS